MAVDPLLPTNSFFAALYTNVGTVGATKRIRPPTFTAEQGEGTYTGKLANGRAVSFTVSDVKNGLARVRYVSDGETKSAQVQINGNILRLDNVQLSILSNGRGQFARVDTSTGNLQQATLQR